MSKENIPSMNPLSTINAQIEDKVFMERSCTDWINNLRDECQVYTYKEAYLAKNFNSINYKFCDEKRAIEILKNNLYALLKYKYFHVISDEVMDKIKDIVTLFTQNIKTSLVNVSFDYDTDAKRMYLVPDYCVAFRNGVYNFLRNDWEFKYQSISLEDLHTVMYLYEKDHVILWYLNYNFEPIPEIDVKETTLSGFVQFLRDLDKEDHQMVFEILWNMSHDIENKFSMDMFTHICEILGYTLNQSQLQYFVILLGSGQNGKNTLFDGCITNKLVPSPAHSMLDAFEDDRFVTGALENKTHNISLETKARAYEDLSTLKDLTGATDIDVEHKGVDKYSSYINCKFIFSANNREDLKFGDTSDGFQRRINMLELFWRWDKEGNYLTYNSDYYDTKFKNISELQNNNLNTTLFIYFALFGMKSATKNFTEPFQFTFNDWSNTYLNVDYDIKQKIANITFNNFILFLERRAKADKGLKNLRYHVRTADNKEPFFGSDAFYELGYKSEEKAFDMMKKNDENTSAFLSDHDLTLSLAYLQKLVVPNEEDITAQKFTSEIASLYHLNLQTGYGNRKFVKIRFENGGMKIIKR